MVIREVPEPRAQEVAELLAATPYRLVGWLGAGGMGEVFVVEHGFLGRRFALKLMHRHLRVAGLLERFEFEARALARLRHPHIVEVIDFWLAPCGTPCLVLELLEGSTVAVELRRRRRFPLDEALRIAGQALSGLAAAHAQGIVHRDVKPDNLFLDRASSVDGEPVVKILDFGLARLMAAAIEGPVVHTTTGAIVGSYRYMSPEGRRGERVDQRADIYSTGAVLYEMLVGEASFDGSRAHFEPPSVRLADPGLADLNPVLARALHATVAERYASAEDFLGDLRNLRENLPRGQARSSS